MRKADFVRGKKIINCHPKWTIYEMNPLGVTLHYIVEK